MTILATATAVISARYFTLDSDMFLVRQRAVYLAHLAPLLFHISGGVLALALGPWQFVPRLRRRHPTAHRAVGRAYRISAVLPNFGVPYDQAYRAGAWISWPINLLIVQRILARGRTTNRSEEPAAAEWRVR